MSLKKELESIDEMALAKTFMEFRAALQNDDYQEALKQRYPHMARCVGMLAIAAEEAGLSEQSVAMYSGGLFLLAAYAQSVNNE